MQELVLCKKKLASCVKTSRMAMERERERERERRERERERELFGDKASAGKHSSL